jgi:hypothetical protein
MEWLRLLRRGIVWIGRSGGEKVLGLLMKTGIGLALGLLVLLFLVLARWLVVLMWDMVRRKNLVAIIFLSVRRIMRKTLCQAPVSMLAMKRMIVITMLSLGLVASCWFLSLVIAVLLVALCLLNNLVGNWSLLARRSLPAARLVLLLVLRVMSLCILARGVFAPLYRDHILSMSSATPIRLRLGVGAATSTTLTLASLFT